jgi:ATP-binding cassette, subfamily C, bacterial
MSFFWPFFSAFISFQPWRAFASFSVMLLTSLMQGFSLLLLIPMLNMIADSGHGSAPGMLAKLMPESMHQLPLYALLLIYTAIVSCTALIKLLNSRLTVKLQTNMTSHYRLKLARLYIHLDWLELCKVKRSELNSVVTKEIERISAGAMFLLRIISTTILSLVYLITAFALSVKLTLIAMVAGAIIFGLLRYQKGRAYKLGERYHQGFKEMFSLFTDKLNTIKLVKTYGIENEFIDELKECNDQLIQSRYATSQLTAINNFSYTIYGALGFSVFFYCAATYFNIAWSLLLVMLVIFSNLLSRLSNIQQTLQNLSNMLPAYKTIKSMIDKYSENQTKQSDAAQTTINLVDKIELNNLCFKYDKNSPLLFDNKGFVIPAKKITAVTAPSGTGKTTLIDIILGLITPTSGAMTIDGVELTVQNIRAWKDHVSYVPQEPLFFNGSLKENLLWGASLKDDDDIWRALKMARAEDFVARLPEGLNAQVNDFANNLSGGEKQRLMLVRAFLRKPQLLVLDEATNALDYANEKIIFETLRNLKNEITIIIISHRVESLSWVDNIINLAEKKSEDLKADSDSLISLD